MSPFATGAGLSRRGMLGVGAGVVATLAASGAVAEALTKPQGAGDRVLQIRNATMQINYAGARFLIDPMMADQGAYPGFPGSAMSHLRNPLVPLPMPVSTLVDVDAVIVTHTHIDHWDEAAQRALPKTMPIFAQNGADADTIRSQGFSDVRILGADTLFKGVRLARTGGHHGGDRVLEAIPILDPVSGVVLSKAGHETVYVVGDTIWNDLVAAAITNHRPDVIILNAGYAHWVDLGPILMGPQDVLAVSKAAPNARLIATHMEAVNHCILSRADLRAFAEKEGFSSRLDIPRDGEWLAL
ncbi:metal-dependent hydrolase [compost metagenome]